MQKSSHSLIALYDASPEHAHFESPVLREKARALGHALGKLGLGIVARLGSPAVETTFLALKDSTAVSIALSPAATPNEHERAYRLPFLGMPLIFTGRGALGADTVALYSGSAVMIIGSYPGALENILECIKDSSLPIGILSDEDVPDVHHRVQGIHHALTARLFISHDPAVLAREINDELRRRSLDLTLKK